ncbi:uncharacterized protein TEOVI_000080800 [Trypanosoma equiperdum]|uniref:Trypanosome variant surface glycoprotein (A-type) n=1 Tax=Trypanosoma equiperdum TaxID=5694 RepID=A0A1G4IAJ1_TRYEQ|nr:hypothetical protein, conserved [Trypanosoma equiperdum]
MFISISRYVTLLTAPVLHRSSIAATKDGLDDAGKQIIDSCGEIGYDLALASISRQQATAATSVVLSLSDSGAALRLAAAAAVGRKKTAGLRALANIDEANAMAALKSLPSYAQSLDAAATALETRAHRLIMYRKLRIKTLAPEPANAVATESSPEASTVVTKNNDTVTTVEEAANCSIDDLTSGHKVNQKEVKADEIYKLKMINDAILKQASITLKAA